MQEIKKHDLRQSKTFHRFVESGSNSQNKVATKKKSFFGIFFKMVLWVAVFGGGIFLGYYMKPEKEKIISVSENKSCTQQSQKLEDALKSNMQYLSVTSARADILRDYVNFIFLPKEKIGNTDEYAKKMEEKIVALGDENLLQKFYATGEKNEEKRNANVLDFINEVINGFGGKSK